MSGSGARRHDDKEKEEDNGGWASTFLKVAGAAAATAAVAGGLYSLLKQPQSNVAPFTVQNNREEEVILFVDGSLPGKIPSAGCGGFLTNTSGEWICGFAQKLNPNLREDETEKEAILRGLLWVKGKGKKRVKVKNDNEGVVKLVNNSERRSNDPLICGIRDLLRKSDNWHAELIHISGDENKVADRLAHKSHRLTSFDLYEFNDPPENCVSLLPIAS